MIHFRVPGQPDPLNVMLRMNKHKRNRINKSWYDIVNLMVKNQLPPKPLKKAQITVTIYNNRQRDYDGAVGSLKPIIDGLVHAGVLHNDTYKITGPWFVTQEFCKKGLELIEILVVER